MSTRRRVKPYRCGYACDHLIDPAAPPDLASISYGGGVQSTALLVLAKRGIIPFSTFLFCNVGDDSEHPATLEYVDKVAIPYARDNGIDMQVLDRVRRDGTTETLWGRLMREDSRSLPIPVRMSNGAPGNRSCTADFKIRVVGRWLKHHGAHGAQPCPAHKPEQVANRKAIQDANRGCPPEARLPVPWFYAVDGCGECVTPHRATVGIGISLDEIQRANTRVKDDWERVVYPLVGIGADYGLKMRRDDCMSLIRDEGLPVPPKSSCFFCPFHKPAAWSDLARETPDLFKRAVELEDTLNERRTMLGKDPVFLTRFNMPLAEAIDTDQPLLPLFDVSDDTDAQCDSGYCWT